ncbi:uncharacterized protein LOC126367515 [Pectinophora gossypiella]|uniref:uncharacterized protein LOC126367515 n=1 Tax=Pectinophora gossypiella TaxID=13191 RepID=UPI00214ED8EB|nr:uncharacterized protein LOC126367515 [Pectinophora gossypiella]
MMESQLSLFLTVFYWVTYEMTTTGFDVFQPSSLDILQNLVVGLLFGAMVTTYCAVRVISIRCNVNHAYAKFRSHLTDIFIFMKREKLDKDLQWEVKQYYEYVWDKTGGTDYRTVLKLCDQITLRTDAILHVYGGAFSKCPILYDSDVSLIRVLGRAVYSSYFRQGMVIIERDDVISDLYFVDDGTMDLRYSDDDEHVLSKLPVGSAFGNLDNVETQVCPNRFIACSNVHILKINSLIFHDIIQDFPVVRMLLVKYRPNQENYIIGSVPPGTVQTIWKDQRPVYIIKRENTINLNTHNHFFQLYLVLVSLACVFGDVYNAGFQCNNTIILGVLYLLDVAFFIKIVMHYSFPFIDEEELNVAAAIAAARKRYYKKDFKVDMFTLLPFELLSMLAPQPWDVFAYLRLNRFLRVVTIRNSLARYQLRLDTKQGLVTGVTTFIWFSVFVHVAASIWYHIAYHEDFQQPHSSWLWTTGPLRQHEKVGSDYLTSLYFIIVTFSLSGTKEILPRLKSEVFFTCVLMIVSTLIYMLYVGEFSNVIHYQAYRCFSFFTKFLEMQEFLLRNRVSPNLIKLAKSYSLYLWRESRGYQSPQFVVEAPQVLKEKIMSAAFMRHLDNHPIFGKCEHPLRRQVVACMKPYYYEDGMYVVKEGEMPAAMFFVHRGSVQELDEEMEQELKLYKPGEFFGTLQGLHHDIAYTLTYTANTRSQVLMLCLDDWEFLLPHYPVSNLIIYPPKDKPADAHVEKRYEPPPVQHVEAKKEKKKVFVTKKTEVKEIENEEDEHLIKLDDVEPMSELDRLLEEATLGLKMPVKEQVSTKPAAEKPDSVPEKTVREKPVSIKKQQETVPQKLVSGKLVSDSVKAPALGAGAAVGAGTGALLAAAASRLAHVSAGLQAKTRSGKEKSTLQESAPTKAIWIA